MDDWMDLYGTEEVISCTVHGAVKQKSSVVDPGTGFESPYKVDVAIYIYIYIYIYI